MCLAPGGFCPAKTSPGLPWRSPPPPAVFFGKSRNSNPEVVRDLRNGSRGAIPVDGLSRQPLGLYCGVDLNSGSGFDFLLWRTPGCTRGY